MGPAYNGQIPAAPTNNTPYGAFKKIDNYAVLGITTNSLSNIALRSGGFLVTKTNTCNGNGAQLDNIFSITGAVEVLALKAECTEATNATTLSTAYFDLYDGTLATEVTDNAGVDLSGIGVGGAVTRDWAATVALGYLNNATGMIIDSDASGQKSVFAPFQAIKKLGAATYIRFCFTGDANTDVDMKFSVVYTPITDNGAIAAV